MEIFNDIGLDAASGRIGHKDEFRHLCVSRSVEDLFWDLNFWFEDLLSKMLISYGLERNKGNKNVS
jgi:hypothetical protein